MLDIRTFDARQGGNVLYKALAHPLAAEAVVLLAARLPRDGLAVYDPEGVADALWALHPAMPRAREAYVHDVGEIGQRRAGVAALPLAALPRSECSVLLVAGFDAGRIVARIRALVPDGMEVVTLDEVRLPAGLLTNAGRYLDKLNFANNWVFFRDAGGLHTRLGTANYWANYGASGVRLWLRLFGGDGAVLAEWEETLPDGPGGSASTAGRCGRGSGWGSSPGSCSCTRWGRRGTTW